MRKNGRRSVIVFFLTFKHAGYGQASNPIPVRSLHIAKWAYFQL